MKQYELDGFRIDFSCNEYGALVVALQERAILQGIIDQTPNKLGWKWSFTIIIPSFTPITQLRKMLPLWVAPYSENLASNILGWLADFLSDENNLKAEQSQLSKSQIKDPNMN